MAKESKSKKAQTKLGTGTQDSTINLKRQLNENYGK